MEPVLKTDSISVGYGKKIVVSGLDIVVNPGEILTIIGPNGAGKSTVLKSIASQLQLITGEVYICNREMSSMSNHEIAKTMSVCLTERISPEKMTCEDVVGTGRYPYTGRLGILSSNDRKIVHESMELTGIAHLADTDVRYISDGQRQTVMLARAIAQQPRILILDEPTSFLDINNKLRLLSRLKELVRSREIAVIATLHELDLVQRFSDKILCIKGNKADRVGIPEEIFSGRYISELYNIESGTFINSFGTAEAPVTDAEPEVFVIGGGGSGIEIYRSLQRKGISFAAGIIHENDIEYPVAQSLAVEIVSERAFEPISINNIEKSLEIIKKCNKVICRLEKFGTMNYGNQTLLEYAEANHKLIKEAPER